MKTKKAYSSAKPVKLSKAKPAGHKLPPDPDGLFKRAAARAEQVISFYDDLNPDWPRRDLVFNIIFDLMHLCDRDPKLGSVDQAHGRAFEMYDEFIKENELFTA